MDTIIPKAFRRSIPWPAQVFQAALAGAIAANLTAVLPSLWDAVFANDRYTGYALSFIPYIVGVATILGMLAGTLIVGLGHLARKIASLASRNPLPPAIAAGTTVLVLGLAVAAFAAAAGYGLAVWPAVIVTLVGALMAAWQSYDPDRPTGRSSEDNLLEGW
jgi:hypothetical protein